MLAGDPDLTVVKLDVDDGVVALAAQIGDAVARPSGQGGVEAEHEGVRAAGMSRRRGHAAKRAIPGRAGDHHAPVLDHDPGDVPAHGAEIARGRQGQLAGSGQGVLAHDRASVLDRGGIDAGPRNGDGGDRILSRSAELDDVLQTRGDGRDRVSLMLAEGPDVAVPIAQRPASGHGRPGATGQDHRAVSGEGDGSGLVFGAGAAPLSPQLTALGGAVEAHQGDVTLALDRLVVAAGGQVAQHPDRTVGRGGAGADGLDALGQIGL